MFIKHLKTIPEGYYQEVIALLRLSFPIIVGQLGTVLLSLADFVMVSPLGKVPIAGVGLANTIFFLIAVVGMGITLVTAPLVSKANARKDIVACNHLFVQGQKVALWAGLIISIITSVLSYFAPLFGQEPAVERVFQSFLLTLSFSAVPMMWFFSLKNFADGLSQTQVATYITFATVAVNVLLNYVFIYGIPPFLPAYHAQGAAIATLLSRVFMFVAMYVYIRSHVFFRSYISQVRFWESNWELHQRLWRMGVPAGLQYFFEIGAFTGATILMGWLGSASLAAHQIALNLSTTTYLVAVSFSVAGSIRVAAALGLGNKTQILRAANVAALSSISFMSLCCVLFLTFKLYLVNLFTHESGVAVIALQLITVAAFFQVSDGTQVLFLGLLRGIGDMRVPTYITLVAYWLLCLPVSYWLAFGYQLGAVGIWIGLLIGLSASAVLLSTRFYLLLRYRFKDIAQEALAKA